MAESKLTLKKADFMAKVGTFLGWGSDSTKWSELQTDRLKDCVDSGYRQFIVPRADPATGASHDWSFLRPVLSVTLASGDQTVALPDDYGSLDGQITVSQTSGTNFWPVTVTGEGRIREMYGRLPSATGRPLYAAERPLKGVSNLKSSRSELVVYPEANDTFTLSFAYFLIPEALSDENPYCYGGMQHSETILESCLSIAEERINDVQGGLHAGKFTERLAASVAIDRRNKAQNLGYNGDRSDARSLGYWSWREKYLSDQITYNGLTPG